MMIRWRYDRGVIKRVDVRGALCPALACFIPARHTIRSSAGASGSEEWECLTRDQRGCPAITRPADATEGAYRKRGGAWEWVPS